MRFALLPASEFHSKAQAYEDLVIYALNIGDGLILNADGGMMKSWRIKGKDLESSSSAELTAQSTRINDVLRRLPVGWMLHIDSIRRPAIGYPIDSRFPDRTSWLIDEERRADYSRSSAHFVSEQVLTATYLCPRDTKQKAYQFFIDHDETATKGDIASAAMREALKEFEHGIDTIEQGFREDLSPSPLRNVLVEHKGGSWVEDAQLRHLIFCATGVDLPVRAHPVKTNLAPVIANQHLRNGDRLRIGDKVVGLITVEDVPNDTYPGILEVLNQQTCSYRVSHRFIVEDRVRAEKEINDARRKHFQGRKGVVQQIMGGEPTHADGDALRMSDDASAALDELKSGEVVFGYWTMCIVMMEDVRPGEAESQANLRLDTAMKEVAAAVNRLGFITRAEDTNTLEAFIGTLPGHGHANLRRSMLSSRNLADYLPTTALWCGESKCPSPMYPPASPPLAVVSTTGTTPFYFNLHVGDVGHTMIAGPTGAGKSTLLAFLLAQHRRYPGARQIAIDLGYSLYTLCQSVGGVHYTISNEGAPTFAPLEHIDQPAELAWAESWVGLLLQQQKVELTAARREAISLALESLSHSPNRSLTDLTLQPYLDDETRRAIRWYTIERTGGGLMDARTTKVSQGSMTVFEMEALRELGQPMMVPTLIYVFHLIEGWLNQGSPTLFTLDEVWSMLSDPQQAEKIKLWLKTLRKKNAAVVFATQSLEDLLESEIRSTLIQSCPTKIFLANTGANDSDISRSAYRSFGLTDWQIQMISKATPKRDYYVVQPAGKRLISLDLGAPSLAFLGVSDPKDVRQVRELIADDHREMVERGTPNASLWPAKWLDYRASSAWAKHWIDGPPYARPQTVPPPVSYSSATSRGAEHVA